MNSALIGFLLSLTPLCMDLMGWRGATSSGAATVGYYWFAGGLLMILGSLGEVKLPLFHSLNFFKRENMLTGFLVGSGQHVPICRFRHIWRFLSRSRIHPHTIFRCFLGLQEPRVSYEHGSGICRFQCRLWYVLYSPSLVWS